jgi:hypothetical protein
MRLIIHTYILEDKDRLQPINVPTTGAQTFHMDYT